MWRNSILGMLFALGMLQSAQAFAASITLPETLQAALDAAYELKLAEIDVSLSQTDVKKARADFYPTLTTRFNAENVSDLARIPRPGSAVQFVGGTTILSNNIFQASGAATINYTLLDFGIRRRNLKAAKLGVASKKATLRQRQREILVNAVDAYGNALMNYVEIQLRQKIISVAQERVKLKQALFDYGAASKVDVSDAALVTAQNLITIENLKGQLAQAFNDLSKLTRQNYQNDTEVSPIDSQDEVVELPARENIAEYQTLTQEIEKKKQQYEVLLRQRYAPIVSLYSNYFIYGANPSNVLQAFENIDNRSANVGFSVSLSVFDGFKNAADRDKVKLEIERLQVEREQAVFNFQTDFLKNKNLVESLKNEIRESSAALAEQSARKAMVDRLSVAQMVEKTEQLQSEISLLTEQIGNQKAKARQAVAQQKLMILGKGGA